MVAPYTKIRDMVKGFETKMQCNCDLDNWQPEPETGHSWVCRIHKAAKEELRTKLLKGTWKGINNG
jgi:hypothetical protein